MEVTREEVNGLGGRVNAISTDVAGHDEAIKTIKEDRRDLWNTIASLRKDVNAISTKVGGIVAGATVLQAFFFWYFAKK